jgi:preprotein translocase subunit SecA
MAEPPPEPALPQMVAHHVDPTTGEDELALADAAFAAFSDDGSAAGQAPQRDPQNPSTWGRVGRNEACPCGSGKKYKHCHGQIA